MDKPGSSSAEPYQVFRGKILVFIFSSLIVKLVLIIIFNLHFYEYERSLNIFH